jgi:pyruvate dehydrogenase E2 component (dihydrolipoamide acetyltransferase)
MGTFTMPSLGADMAAGTLVEWLKKPGDRVARGDIMAVVETDKGAIEVEIFEDGTVDRLLIEPGAKVPVGTPMALIHGAAGAPTLASAEPARKAVNPPTLATAEFKPQPGQPAAASAVPGFRISPAARRLATERGIDTAHIVGTGPDGAITLADIERTAPPLARRAERGPDLTAMRRAIGAAMARSKREIPHYYLSHDIEMTRAQTWLDQSNANRPPAERLLLQVLLLKAVAGAVRQRSEFNGFYTAGRFQASERVHIGTAIAIRGGGLIAPAIHDVDRLTLAELMDHLRDLVGRARAGSLRSSELSDATITVTSLGERGVEALFGVIYPPQVAIIGFGAVSPRPWVVESRVEPRPLMTASLAADHRVSDGHRGALLLMDIAQLLQEPDKL